MHCLVCSRSRTASLCRCCSQLPAIADTCAVCLDMTHPTIPATSRSFSCSVDSRHWSAAANGSQVTAGCTWYQVVVDRCCTMTDLTLAASSSLLVAAAERVCVGCVPHHCVPVHTPSRCYSCNWLPCGCSCVYGRTIGSACCSVCVIVLCSSSIAYFSLDASRCGCMCHPSSTVMLPPHQKQE